MNTSLQPDTAVLLSAPETIYHLSNQIARSGLSEISLLSEKSDIQSYAWEEWRIRALCTGSLDNIYSFIETLESSGTYFDLDFTIHADHNGSNNLNFSLLFYAYS